MSKRRIKKRSLPGPLSRRGCFATSLGDSELYSRELLDGVSLRRLWPTALRCDTLATPRIRGVNVP
eukprot:3624798-Pyramimonas_sp.AAC.1